MEFAIDRHEKCPPLNMTAKLNDQNSAIPKSIPVTTSERARRPAPRAPRPASGIFHEAGVIFLNSFKMILTFSESIPLFISRAGGDAKVEVERVRFGSQRLKSQMPVISMEPIGSTPLHSTSLQSTPVHSGKVVEIKLAIVERVSGRIERQT
jgi:hypothetical protein